MNDTALKAVEKGARIAYVDVMLRVLVLGFVLLVVMTLADLKKLGAVRIARPVMQAEVVRKPVDKKQLSDAMADSLASLKQDGVDSTVTDQGVEMVLSETLLYQSGKAELTPEGLSILDRILGMVPETGGDVRIAGHTDNEPIRHATAFSSNYELSMVRALNVARYFVESGMIEASRVSATGYGASNPRFPNDSPENQAKNRRVEIVLQNGGEDAE